MTWRAHLIAGLISALLLHILNLADMSPLLLFGAILGSLFPDLDHPQSKAHRAAILMLEMVATMLASSLIALMLCRRLGLSPGLWANLVGFSSAALLFLSFISLIPKLTKHRGAWHNCFGLLCGLIILYSVRSAGLDPLPLLKGFSVAYLSHLLLDALS